MKLVSLMCFFIVALVIALFSAQTYAEDLSASVDRNTISFDETLTLTLQYTGNSARGTPDFSKLEENFSILSRESGNKIFGDMSNLTALTEWTMVLSPKSKGDLVIPAFSYGNLKSKPISVSVKDAKDVPKGEVKEVFLETVVEKNSIYVQEQLVLKYRLFYSINIDSLEREPIEIENVITEQLPDVRYNRTINGKVYGIAEFNYALYPQTSDDFDIPELVWDIKIPKARRSRSTFFDFNGRYEVKRLRTDAHSVTVLPKASDYPSDAPWLPAKNLTLEESWSKDPQEFKVGEPLTRTLTLRAEGLTAAQLPQIWASQSEGQVKVYTDQPDLADEKLAEGSVAKRVESAAVVVSQSGVVELPALRVPWWDVNSNSLKYAELPARSIEVSGGTKINQANTQTGGASQGLNGDLFSPGGGASSLALNSAHRQMWIWRIISAVLALALLATLLRQYAVAKKGTTSSSPEESTSNKAAVSRLVGACKKKAPEDIRAALINWANEEWPDRNTATLDEIARRIDDAELSTTLRDLDASLYAPAGQTSRSTIDTSLIVKSVKNYLAHKNRDASRNSLEEFYAS